MKGTANYLLPAYSSAIASETFNYWCDSSVQLCVCKTKDAFRPSIKIIDGVQYHPGEQSNYIYKSCLDQKVLLRRTILLHNDLSLFYHAAFRRQHEIYLHIYESRFENPEVKLQHHFNTICLKGSVDKSNSILFVDSYSFREKCNLRATGTWKWGATSFSKQRTTSTWSYGNFQQGHH